MNPSMTYYFIHFTAYSLLTSRAACFYVHNSKVAPTLSTTLYLQNGYLQSLESNGSVKIEECGSTEECLIDSYTSGATEECNLLTEECVSDPYASGVAEAFGLISGNGVDGFDSASDSVGPGIYGGSVQRDNNGDILIGTQYENHNHVPGPLYDGNGYSLMGRAIHLGKDKVNELLRAYPQLLEEISTGGARPLHICGMSERGQHSAQTLIDAGADIHALDTYNYNALHRMASNDLEIGAAALVQAGLDPNSKDDKAGSTPIEIAKRQRAIKFLMMMQKMGHYD